MSGPATSYAEISREVSALIARHTELEPEVGAYIVMRAAALLVRGRRGDEEVAKLLYKLADEMATGGVTE